MGRTLAPSYANLYAGLFKEKFIYRPRENPFTDKIFKQYPYINDIVCLSDGNADELQDFTKFLNEKDPNLQLTVEHAMDRELVTDMWVKKKSDTLCTTIHRKETETPSCLPIVITSHP